MSIRRVIFTADKESFIVRVLIKKVQEGEDNVYAALTGNLCALMDIRVR